MALSALHLLSAAVLCLASLSIITGSSQSQDSAAHKDSNPSRLASSSLAHILRRRSAPHIYASRAARAVGEAVYWIWMPTHDEPEELTTEEHIRIKYGGIMG